MVFLMRHDFKAIIAVFNAIDCNDGLIYIWDSCILFLLFLWFESHWQLLKVVVILLICRCSSNLLVVAIF